MDCLLRQGAAGAMSCSRRRAVRLGGLTSSPSLLLRCLFGPSNGARRCTERARVVGRASASSTTARRSAMASRFITAISVSVGQAMVVSRCGRHAVGDATHRSSLTTSPLISRACLTARAICSGGGGAVSRSVTTGRG